MNDDAGRVFCACLAAMARRGAADPKGRAPAEMPLPLRAPARDSQDWKEGSAPLGPRPSRPGTTPVDDNQPPMRYRCDATAQAQRFAHVAAREQDLGAAFTLTREPPRRRRIKATRFHCSTPHFDMSATLATFCLRPDETNFSSPAASPAKAHSRSKREAAPSKQRPAPRHSRRRCRQVGRLKWCAALWKEAVATTAR